MVYFTRSKQMVELFLEYSFMKKKRQVISADKSKEEIRRQQTKKTLYYVVVKSSLVLDYNLYNIHFWI